MDTSITSGKIVRILKEIGIEEIRSGIGGNGVAAVIHGALPGKCLGIRADCDGLPIKEKTGLPFASTNGNMPACGHDAHTAMALGAAPILWNYRNELKGTEKYYDRLCENCKYTAAAMKCSVDVNQISHMDENINDPEMTKIFLETAQEIVDKEHIFKM